MHRLDGSRQHLCSQSELRNFFSSKVWSCLQEELLSWIEDIRDLLEDPSSVEDYSAEQETIITAKLRGNIEALRQITLLDQYLLVEDEEAQNG